MLVPGRAATVDSPNLCGGRSLGGLLQFTTRMVADVEARFISVERVTAYIDTLPSEAPSHMPDADPPPEWPQYGAIRVDQLSIQYRPELPAVLNGVSFDIRAGERIGIAGRTGSGKSSLMISLFRMLEASACRPGRGDALIA